jgi:hypothetical protein
VPSILRLSRTRTQRLAPAARRDADGLDEGVNAPGIP